MAQEVEEFFDLFFTKNYTFTTPKITYFSNKSRGRSVS